MVEFYFLASCLCEAVKLVLSDGSQVNKSYVTSRPVDSQWETLLFSPSQKSEAMKMAATPTTQVQSRGHGLSPC